jgi:hypothetical protein
MKKPFQFRTRLAASGEIIAQPAKFLPVKPLPPSGGRGDFAPETLDSGVFLPVFDKMRKNITVAQPLLKGGSR